MAEVNIKRGSKKPQKTVIQDLTLVAPDRNRKDVGKLKTAVERAESIHMPSRTALYDLYHDVVSLDGHLSGILQKRTGAVANKTLKFVKKGGKKVDAMDDLIGSLKFNRLVELIMEQRYWGVSGVEFIVGQEFDFEEIPRKHIRIEKGQIVKSQYDFTGTPIDELPFVWVVGNKYELGRLLQCSMYALYKRSGFGDFAQYVEIFGQPVRIIYYDAYDTRTKQELRTLLDNTGSSLAMMIPKQAQFEMLDGKTSNANGDLQTKLIRSCNDEMDIAILGNTETTSSSSSSGYAQAKEHGKQQLEITKSDLKFVANTLNDPAFLKILASYGYPVEGGAFEFEMDVDLDNLKKRLDIDTAVAGKVPVADDYWYETYGIPKPDNYDELKAKQEERREVAAQPPANGGCAAKQPPKKMDAKAKNLFDSFLDFFGLAPRQQSEGALEWE